jgi:hypothetical protein
MDFFELVRTIRRTRGTLLHDFVRSFADAMSRETGMPLPKSMTYTAFIGDTDLECKDPRLEGCSFHDVFAAFMAKKIAICYKSYVSEWIEPLRARGLKFMACIDPDGISATVVKGNDGCEAWTITSETNGRNSLVLAYGMPIDPMHFFNREIWSHLNRLVNKVPVEVLGPDDIPTRKDVDVAVRGALVLWARACTGCREATLFNGSPVCPACESDASAMRLLTEIDDQKNAKMRRKELRKQKTNAMKADAAMLRALEFASHSDRSELVSLGFVL